MALAPKDYNPHHINCVSPLGEHSCTDQTHETNVHNLRESEAEISHILFALSPAQEPHFFVSLASVGRLFKELTFRRVGTRQRDGGTDTIWSTFDRLLHCFARL